MDHCFRDFPIGKPSETEDFQPAMFDETRGESSQTFLRCSLWVSPTPRLQGPKADQQTSRAGLGSFQEQLGSEAPRSREGARKGRIFMDFHEQFEQHHGCYPLVWKIDFNGQLVFREINHYPLVN